MLCALGQPVGGAIQITVVIVIVRTFRSFEFAMYDVCGAEALRYY